MFVVFDSLLWSLFLGGLEYSIAGSHIGYNRYSYASEDRQ